MIQTQKKGASSSPGLLERWLGWFPGASLPLFEPQPGLLGLCILAKEACSSPVLCSHRASAPVFIIVGYLSFHHNVKISFLFKSCSPLPTTLDNPQQCNCPCRPENTWEGWGRNLPELFLVSPGDTTLLESFVFYCTHHCEIEGNIRMMWNMIIFSLVWQKWSSAHRNFAPDKRV